MLNRPSNIAIRFGDHRWSLPVSLLGIWAIQSTNFQKDHDIYTESGFFSFLGWFIHNFEHQLIYHHYIAQWSIEKKTTGLKHLLTANLVASPGIYIPVFFYLIQSYRKDLQDSFDMSTHVGRFRFFQWVAARGHQEYEKHPVYSAHIERLVSVHLDDAAKKDLLAEMPFNELWYLAHYRDVKDAVDAGTVNSGFHHWQCLGKFADRLPNAPVNEAWYLDVYPGVDGLIKKGHLVSPAQHWALAGYREGRLPYPPEVIKFSLEVS